MKKKRGLEIKIKFTNKWLYTLITIGILMIVGVGVYALTPGIAPNPGHLINNVAPPTGCTGGQILGWDGSVWGCVDKFALTTSCTGGQVLGWDGSVWGCVDKFALTTSCTSGQFLMWDGSAWDCADAIIIEEYTYEWIVVIWGACSMPCATGTQTGTLQCERDDEEIVDDTFCSGTPPTTTRECNTQTCAGYGCNACSFGRYLGPTNFCTVPLGRESRNRRSSTWSRWYSQSELPGIYCVGSDWEIRKI